MMQPGKHLVLGSNTQAKASNNSVLEPRMSNVSEMGPLVVVQGVTAPPQGPGSSGVHQIITASNVCFLAEGPLFHRPSMIKPLTLSALVSCLPLD